MIICRDMKSMDEFLDWTATDTLGPYRDFTAQSVLDNWHAMATSTYLVHGHCQACQEPSKFILDDLYAPRTVSVADGPSARWQPNWRERLSCQRCGLNNRLRATLTLMAQLETAPETSTWLCEQTTPLYQHLAQRMPRLVGSEFLGAQEIPGSMNDEGIRHEDATCLSFPDESLGLAVSLDVLEHIPDYRAALRETHRALIPGGYFLWSAPFLHESRDTLIRASVTDLGEVIHHEPAEYHGDPLNPEGGVLCFQHFGWDVLDSMRDIGFEDACVRIYWSDSLANLGSMQFFFVGRK